MSQIEVEVRLESPEGSTVDEMTSLKQEIEAEVRATADVEGVSLKGTREAEPPRGAQGLPELVQWFLEVASNDPQAVLYGLSLTLREILAHYRSRNDDPDDQQGNVTVNVIINGRTISLSDEGSRLREQIEEAVRKDQSPDQ
jgi:hypothetical protein